ncbi:MaoC/PaaZ C-terminal domain-containing protein [Alteromonas ponticola]|uniref:MaoC/PaaZ C-terminal domain-containing protein n=1 Tax=Alteromonas aquimaris TaxID=2998417 RepID=A0ABT3PA11_9ALTE|nr:MaoC/PaaZ C-terminal domain-containing protein [Alteromonas aquimaris]MCW8108901.1 MaoC/PaaZ C-terminal domain-containing protein [Alteromonas aquimaris]
MQLIRAALKRGNKNQLNAWFHSGQPIALPDIVSSIHFTATDFDPKLAAFNQLHDWHYSYLHPCFPQFLGLPQTIDALAHHRSPFPLMGLVHLENRIESIKKLRNDDLRIDCRLSDIATHARGVTTTIEMSVYQFDKLCLQASSKYLYRIVSDKVTPNPSHTDSASSAPISRVLEDAGTMRFGENAGRKYASLSGDYNPIHLSKLTAKIFGFKTNIAHGMHVLALTLSKLNTNLFEQPYLLSSQFNHPVALPCTAHLKRSAHVMPTEQDLSFELHDPTASRRKQVVLTGTASAHIA